MADSLNISSIKLDEAKKGELDILLEEHATEIAALKESLKDVIGEENDDIWLLRFILSNKTAKDSEEPCRFTIKYRNENKEDIKEIQTHHELPSWKIILQYNVFGDHGATSNGEPIFLVRVGLSNPKALMDNVSHDEVLKFMVLNREIGLMRCDASSRKERRLVKMITLLDFQGISISRIDSRFNNILAETSKLSEKMYPQLLGRNILVNAPSLVYYSFNMLKPFLSKRSVAKVVFCSCNTSGKSISVCPYVKNYLGEKNVPSFLGGKCMCNHGCCVGGVPNSQTTPLDDVDADGKCTITIGARDMGKIEIVVAKGSTIDYFFEIESRNIEISANVHCSKSEVSEDEEEKKSVVELLPKTNLDSDSGAVKGQWTAISDGTLICLLDNRSSYLRSKKMKYNITVKFPEPVVPNKNRRRSSIYIDDAKIKAK